ncbi:hypothetical protein AXF42_Ash007681 [Apostasia shenzhenica]|uniref:Uncharacterized protein n=1 Tax=Apostasia shenzhenica TaxID=1088818 RepID=A0A2I0A664_9ASPA|nr:hypothetical protein AXF42_Ash007681 [Apostasia shenzhenica]
MKIYSWIVVDDGWSISRARGLTWVNNPAKLEAESANQSIKYRPVRRHAFGQDAAQEPHV